ncbi:glutamine amidotransferase class-I [Pusillimonas sp. T2]|uniref:type 1 glutamine amidotransferase n=1 Tax=Pusillimonas sp. T2 TaxID=1548123 RepID=UPI000B9CA9CB|nr:type 1 glutamine amidotransferase [Pusillimonas sp. T2]OXR49992.1 glutamine amidotransferase class-I [Pusillimonas sp. T2]
MKPVAIFQHSDIGRPGSVIDIINALGLSYSIIETYRGEPVPRHADDFSGLIFMGGPMGVNDNDEWLEHERDLIRRADAQDIPVAGHCLGAQQLAKALGATVQRNVRPEIGWQPIAVESDPLALRWWGVLQPDSLLTFQWHSDTFELPDRAHRIATGIHCANQAFVVRDLHIGMQSHFEMTPALVHDYYQRNGAFLRREHAAGNPAVTSVEDTLSQLDERTDGMKAVLQRVYTRWALGLKA